MPRRAVIGQDSTPDPNMNPHTTVFDCEGGGQGGGKGREKEARGGNRGPEAAGGRGQGGRRPTAPPTPRALNSLARDACVAAVIREGQARTRSREPKPDAAPDPDGQILTRCQGAKQACCMAGAESPADGLRAPLRRLIDFAASAPAPASVGSTHDPDVSRPYPPTPPSRVVAGSPARAWLPLTHTHPPAGEDVPFKLACPCTGGGSVHGRRPASSLGAGEPPERYANHARCPPSP